ncbi:unnamed protein product [Diatraea saccharalis]|uniref:Ig-like domain-containing protein n=1 Tax=Diatraea saccharalis TaxID=40085 RepID=A0A9N9WEG4_9NEOP|nr:unnamed protein product [Diatraea saccharalis]
MDKKRWEKQRKQYINDPAAIALPMDQIETKSNRENAPYVIHYVGPLRYGSAQSHPVSKPPVLKELPQEVLFRVGEKLELSCEIESGDTSDVKFEWISAFQDLKGNPNIVENNQKLVFKNMKDTDEGFYQCIANTSAGIASTRRVKVTKSYINIPKISIQKMKPVEGRPFQLACPPIEGYPKPMVEWKKKSVDTGELETILDPRIFSPQGDLYFANATQEDVSTKFNYVCLVTSPALDGEVPVVEWAVEELTKDEKPADHEVVKQFVSGDKTAKVGDVTEIYCVYGGNPVPHPDWWKDGVNVNNKGDDRVTRYNRSSGKRLLIKETLPEDEGKYTCVIDNEAGGEVQNNTIHLTVVSPPKFVKTPDTRVNVKEGEELILPCKFEMKPSGEVTWTHNTKMLRDQPTNTAQTKDNLHYENNLKIEKITAAIHILLIILEDIPLHLNALGLFQQVLHCVLLKDFPVVRVTSLTFVAAVSTLVLHHYLAFKFFGTVFYSFSEILAYFTLCLWVVPFALFVSLSANDYVLPTTDERQSLLGDNNVVTDYLSRTSKKYSLLSFFSFAKESILPQRTKKAF